MPAHTASGIPEIGQVVTWHVRSGAVNSGGVVSVGLSRTLHKGLPLPLSLTFLGMGPACLLCASVDMTIGVATDATGAADLTLPPLPDRPDMVGLNIYTQASVLDPGAGTRLPIVMSNALDTLIGGDY